MCAVELARGDAESAEAQRLSPRYLPANGSGTYASEHSPITPTSDADCSRLTNDEVRAHRRTEHTHSHTLELLNEKGVELELEL